VAVAIRSTARSRFGALIATACAGGVLGVGFRAIGPRAILLALVLTAVLVGTAQQALP
jgi:hypothetical protein